MTKKTSSEYQAFYKETVESPPQISNNIQELRENIEVFFSKFAPEPDIKYEAFNIEEIPAEWSLAPGTTKEQVILFFHGGGFCAGSLKAHRDFTGKLSKASKKAILSINYRLAPEHPFPAALDDCLKTYDWLLKHRYSPSDLFLAGASCGGGLVVSLCLLLKQEKLPLPAALICISPWVDLTLSSESIYRNAGKDLVSKERIEKATEMYAAGQPRDQPLISPIFGDLTSLPPLFIMVGSIETLLDDGLQLAEKARLAGVETTLDVEDNMIHCWPLYAGKFPEGKKAIEAIASFLRSF